MLSGTKCVCISNSIHCWYHSKFRCRPAGFGTRHKYCGTTKKTETSVKITYNIKCVSCWNIIWNADAYYLAKHYISLNLTNKLLFKQKLFCCRPVFFVVDWPFYLKRNSLNGMLSFAVGNSHISHGTCNIWGVGNGGWALWNKATRNATMQKYYSSYP